MQDQWWSQDLTVRGAIFFFVTRGLFFDILMFFKNDTLIIGAKKCYKM